MNFTLFYKVCWGRDHNSRGGYERTNDFPKKNARKSTDLHKDCRSLKRRIVWVEKRSDCRT